MHRISIQTEIVDLLPEKAIYWPASSTLIVADLHWGKAASFRAAAIPVPSGTTAADLARLDRMIETTGARRLLVLGDLLHAKATHSARTTLDTIRRWREGRVGIECVLVRGNHDHRAGDPPADFRFSVVDRLSEAPFVFQHHPGLSDQGYVLAGHLHPSIMISGRGERIRLPCFHFGPGCGILPAFGSFTGTATPQREPGDRVFVIGDGEVHEA